jgi:hypothetical protein
LPLWKLKSGRRLLTKTSNWKSNWPQTDKGKAKNNPFGSNVWSVWRAHTARRVPPAAHWSKFSWRPGPKTSASAI